MEKEDKLMKVYFKKINVFKIIKITKNSFK